ncbi:MAG: 23S rRNA (adenine(2503)-C(2))-methyltransferase RlmN [Thermodesulfovibrionales bacterium]|nr:23S rRNA (adenine(2503)-C(2))-methyltransferase RlmN [Thermodesulfovibrionales bacterium]
MNNIINIKSLSKNDLLRFTQEQALPRYRVQQLIHWIYQKYVTSIDDITEFSKELRKKLEGKACISNLGLVRHLHSSDGSEKYLFSLEDGNRIESVLIPDENRLTLCISSQVGCAMGCRFCMTGAGGFIRSLQAHEIVDQIISVNRILQPRKVTNLVLMGMGEPFENFDEVVEALWRIVLFLGISKRKITVSTAGVVPKISLFSQKAPEVNLAVSLNAATDEARSDLMPVNRRYPIESLIASCKKFPLQPTRKITFEYVLIRDKNDSQEDARSLVKMLKGLRCKVNLIPFNPFPGNELKRPSDQRILSFQKILLEGHVRALIRESKGLDIQAACGQLRASSNLRT